MPPNSDKYGKYGTTLFYSRKLGFYCAAFDDAVIWYILCRAAKFIDVLKWSKAFMAVYCFIVHGPEVPSDTSATTSDRRMLCGVAL